MMNTRRPGGADRHKTDREVPVVGDATGGGIGIAREGGDGFCGVHTTGVLGSVFVCVWFFSMKTRITCRRLLVWKKEVELFCRFLQVESTDRTSFAFSGVCRAMSTAGPKECRSRRSSKPYSVEYNEVLRCADCKPISVYG